MLRQAEALIGYGIAATDGNIGKVKDIYFDDSKWTVRHLVVDTGSWLSGRPVLISPIAVTSVDEDARVVHVSSTRQQIEDAPGAETDEPVGRPFETRYYDYYGWPYYWTGPYPWGFWGVPTATRDMRMQSPVEEEVRAMDEQRLENRDQHLRSFKDVNGYTVEATDGAMGDVEDILLDDKSWKVRFVVVDTAKLLPSKDVLVAPEATQGIDAGGSTIMLGLTKQQLANQPEFTSIADLADLDETEVVLLTRKGA